MTNPITAFLTGKGHVPPEAAIREQLERAQAQLKSAEQAYDGACVDALTETPEAVKAKAEAKKVRDDAKDAVDSLSRALERTLAIAAQRKAEAEAAEIGRRWRATLKHAEARQKAAENIEQYLDWLRKAVVEFDKQTKAMVAACPRRLMPVRERAMATPSDFHGPLELRLQRLGVIGRVPVFIEWGGTPISEMVAKANEYVASLNDEPQP